MAFSLRDLRTKIKSTNGTKKLTQAMQMVAASKMQRAIKQAESGREYSRISWDIIRNIKSKSDISSNKFLKEREVKSVGLIVVTSNRGLCGGFNAQLLKKVSEYIKSNKDKCKIEIITIGNKGKAFVSRYFKEMFVADFPANDKLTSYADITSVAKLVQGDFENNKYDKIVVFYNKFISTLKQEPSEKQLLPIPNIIEEKIKLNDKNNSNFTEYKFEPDMNSILDVLLPTVVRIQIYQLLLESNASEQSARMVAMKNATDNASDLIDDLTLTYNSLRQAAITKEITEISAGAEALKN